MGTFGTFNDVHTGDSLVFSARRENAVNRLLNEAESMAPGASPRLNNQQVTVKVKNSTETAMPSGCCVHIKLKNDAATHKYQDCVVFSKTHDPREYLVGILKKGLNPSEIGDAVIEGRIEVEVIGPIDSSCKTYYVYPALDYGKPELYEGYYSKSNFEVITDASSSVSTPYEEPAEEEGGEPTMVYPSCSVTVYVRQNNMGMYEGYIENTSSFTIRPFELIAIKRDYNILRPSIRDGMGVVTYLGPPNASYIASNNGTYYYKYIPCIAQDKIAPGEYGRGIFLGMSIVSVPSGRTDVSFINSNIMDFNFNSVSRGIMRAWGHCTLSWNSSLRLNSGYFYGIVELSEFRAYPEVYLCKYTGDDDTFSCSALFENDDSSFNSRVYVPDALAGTKSTPISDKIVAFGIQVLGFEAETNEQET